MIPLFLEIKSIKKDLILMIFLCLQKKKFFLVLLIILFNFSFPHQKALAIEKENLNDSQQIILELFRGKPESKRFSNFIKIKKQVPFQLQKLAEGKITKKDLTRLTKDHSDQVPEIILNWGSGSPNARVFKNQEITVFFSNLFYKIIEMGKKNQLSISINTTDLFHGHLVYLNQKRGDLIIVFHAQEYPHELPFTRQKSIEALVTNKLILKGKKFGHKTISFRRRNFIWSLKENKLFNLNTDYNGPFFPLIFPTGWIDDKELKSLAVLGNSVQDNLLGNGLGSLNFFPDQNAPLYWSP